MIVAEDLLQHGDVPMVDSTGLSIRFETHRDLYRRKAKRYFVTQFILNFISRVNRDNAPHPSNTPHFIYKGFRLLQLVNEITYYPKYPRKKTLCILDL